jgi:penicillin V acylase-like amidase (Ntn superfamily)
MDLILTEVDLSRHREIIIWVSLSASEVISGSQTSIAYTTGDEAARVGRTVDWPPERLPTCIE